jgi:hypothetical protein
MATTSECSVRVGKRILSDQSVLWQVIAADGAARIVLAECDTEGEADHVAAQVGNWIGVSWIGGAGRLTGSRAA